MFRQGKRIALTAMLVLSGCATQQVQPTPLFDAQSRWIVLPFVNLAETPQAGDAAQSIAATLLRIQGRTSLNEYTTAPATVAEIDDNRRQESALTWARSHGFTYAVTGRVQEWRYRIGMDNEPAVGLTVSIVDLRDDRTVWSATGARAGWGNDTVSGTANKLLRELLATLRVK